MVEKKKHHKEKKPVKKKEKKHKEPTKQRQTQKQHQTVNVNLGGANGPNKSSGSSSFIPQLLFNPSLNTPSYGYSNREPVNPPGLNIPDLNYLFDSLRNPIHNSVPVGKQDIMPIEVKQPNSEFKPDVVPPQKQDKQALEKELHETAHNIAERLKAEKQKQKEEEDKGEWSTPAKIAAGLGVAFVTGGAATLGGLAVTGALGTAGTIAEGLGTSTLIGAGSTAVAAGATGAAEAIANGATKATKAIKNTLGIGGNRLGGNKTQGSKLLTGSEKKYGSMDTKAQDLELETLLDPEITRSPSPQVKLSEYDSPQPSFLSRIADYGNQLIGRSDKKGTYSKLSDFAIEDPDEGTTWVHQDLGEVVTSKTRPRAQHELHKRLESRQALSEQEIEQQARDLLGFTTPRVTPQATPQRTPKPQSEVSKNIERLLNQPVAKTTSKTPILERFAEKQLNDNVEILKTSIRENTPEEKNKRLMQNISRAQAALKKIRENKIKVIHELDKRGQLRHVQAQQEIAHYTFASPARTSPRYSISSLASLISQDQTLPVTRARFASDHPRYREGAAARKAHDESRKSRPLVEMLIKENPYNQGYFGDALHEEKYGYVEREVKRGPKKK